LQKLRRNFFAFELVRGQQKSQYPLVFAAKEGLVDHWFLRVGCLERNATQVACGRTSLRRERASEWRAQFCWVTICYPRGERQSVYVVESPCSPRFFLPSAARPHRPLRSPSDFLVPPLLRLHRSHDSQAVFVRLVLPQPQVLGWFAFPHTARSWHSLSS
jgi:hypothetical protein